MRKHFLAIIIAALSIPGLAWAQAGSPILDQDRPDRSPPAAAASPAAPLPQGRGRAEGPHMQVAPFILRAVRVEGGAVPSARLASAWAPMVGRKVGAADLKALADAVAAAYGRSDIALYTIFTPRQTFAGGLVQLGVIEGHVVDVQVSGDGKGRLIEAYAQKLMRPGPLRRSRLERYLSLMRDIPGVKVDATLLRGARPGAVVLKIVAHRRRVDGSLSVNDRGTAYLGRTQARADLWLNGLERQGDQTRLTYAMPIDVNRFQYYGLAQSIALGAEGATATLSAGYIRTKPAYTAIEGSAETLSLQVSHPLWRGYQRSLYLTGALDGVDSTNTAYGQTLYSERVRTLRGAGAYSQQSAVSALTLSATLSQGLNTLGAQTLAPGWSDRSFFKANLAAKWSHGIGKQWVVRLDAVGQFSGDKLPGSEQFALGGDEFGRAFPATVATGDQGGAGSAELAFRPTKLPAPIKGSEVYGFIDGGQIHWQARPNDGYDARTQGLSSAGFGARLAVLSKGVLEVEVARALSNPLPGQDHGWRLTLSVRSLLE